MIICKFKAGLTKPHHVATGSAVNSKVQESIHNFSDACHYGTTSCVLIFIQLSGLLGYYDEIL